MARTTRRAAAKKRIISVDFSSAGQTRFLPPEDEYHLKFAKVDQSESNSGNDQLVVDFEVIGGKHDGKQFRQWYSLVDTAVWKLAGVLRSAGVEIPEEVVDLDLDDMVDREIMAVIEHREYNGDEKAEIKDSWSVDDESGEEEEKPKSRSGKKDEEEKPKRGRRAAKEEPEEEDEKPASRGRRAVKEEDEEEEKPARSKRGAKGKKALPKLAAEEVQDMDEGELEEVVENYSLDVELDTLKTLRKKAAAVIDALDTAGHLEEE
jgi:hypothetical protein